MGDRTRNHYGKIYFLLHDTTSAIKIGFTTNLKRRMKEIARVFPGEKFTLLGFYYGTQRNEHETHKALSDHRLPNEVEWFDYTQPKVAYLVSGMTDG